MILASRDGYAWQRIEEHPEAEASLQRLGFGNGIFVIPMSGNKILRSEDAYTWEAVTFGTLHTLWPQVLYAHDMFLMIGPSSMLVSEDAFQWSLAWHRDDFGGSPDASGNRLGAGNGSIVIGGRYEGENGSFFVSEGHGLDLSCAIQSDIRFSFRTQKGASYQVQHTADLEAQWKNLGLPYTGTGNTIDLYGFTNRSGFLRAKRLDP